MRPITVNGQTYNCGSCINCRINHTSEWAIRLLFELNNWSFASFVTLTYNNENLPKDFSLHPEHLKNFLDCVRYDLSLQKRKFKYYAVGEYGEDNSNSPPGIQHGRPHYHLIMFGLNPDPSDKNNHDRQLIIDNWKKCEDFLFVWKKKHNAIDFVNREDIAYVTGYVQKKLNGKLGAEYYGDRVRPFSRCSLGMGLDYAIKNQNMLRDLGYIMFNGHKIGIPRYFREKLDIKQTELVKDVNIKKIDVECKYLYGLFTQDMKKRGLWREGMPDYMQRRFIAWYDNHMYELSTRVEKDFMQKNKIVGGKFQ